MPMPSESHMNNAEKRAKNMNEYGFLRILTEIRGVVKDLRKTVRDKEQVIDSACVRNAMLVLELQKIKTEVEEEVCETDIVAKLLQAATKENSILRAVQESAEEAVEGDLSVESCHSLTHALVRWRQYNSLKKVEDVGSV